MHTTLVNKTKTLFFLFRVSRNQMRKIKIELKTCSNSSHEPSERREPQRKTREKNSFSLRRVENRSAHETPARRVAQATDVDASLTNNNLTRHRASVLVKVAVRARRLIVRKRVGVVARTMRLVACRLHKLRRVARARQQQQQQQQQQQKPNNIKITTTTIVNQ